MIGVLSDTHNNITNLQLALDVFRKAGVDTIIHCGDLSRSELAHPLTEFHVIFTFGNNDAASGEIQTILTAQNPHNWAGLIYTGVLDGVRVAVSHGHLLAETKALLRAGEYEYVFTGHSHRHKDEWIGSTRHINPGALGGMHPEPRSACLVDLARAQVQFVQIETPPVAQAPASDPGGSNQ